MRFLPPESSIRSHFEYQNEMFLTAGQIIPAITGKSWDDFVRERIFGPLGMTSSLTSDPASPEGMDLASPHVKVKGTMQTIPLIKLYNIAPAGAILSNINDMEKWLRLQMHNGSFNTKQIFSEAAAKEMHSPQTIIPLLDAPPGLPAPDANFFAYGLGWFLHDYHGHMLIDHGGRTDGMTTMVAFAPNDNFGFVILTNADEVPFLESVMFRVFDIGLDRPEKDWNAYYRDIFNKVEDEQKAAKEKSEKEHVVGTKPSLPLASYAGKYTDNLYGPVEISLNGDKLSLRFTDLGFNADLEHWQYDTFRINWRITDHLADASVKMLTFVLDADGKPSQLRVERVGEFHRVP
jgi:CubicO group peptidase (beta-lactamase class C family)